MKVSGDSAATFHDWGSITVNENLLPSQWKDMRAKYGELRPELKLCLIVLETAIQDYQAFGRHDPQNCRWCAAYRARKDSRCHRAERYREAHQWLMVDEAPNVPFSMHWVCDMLSFDVSWIRKGLAAMATRLPRRGPVLTRDVTPTATRPRRQG